MDVKNDKSMVRIRDNATAENQQVKNDACKNVNKKTLRTRCFYTIH